MFRRFDLEHNDLEHIVAEIQIPNRKPFLITCVYIPPREANHVTLTTLSDMLARCLDSKLELILMGDLNFNLLPGKDDSLSALCESYHMDQLIHTPTRVTSHSESLLDIVITTNKEVVCDSGVLIHSMSAHHAVYCVRKSTLKLSPRFSTYCDMRNFNSDSFCRDLSQVPWSICEIFNDINDCYYAWYTLFMEIANEHAPIRTKKCKKRQVPWMNLEIKELMRQRDLIRRTASKQKKEIYFKLYKCLRNHLTSELRKAKREYFYYLLPDKSPTPQTFWNNVKQLLPSNCQKNTSIADKWTANF